MAFGILLHQRGHLVLHASAVAVEGKAVAFCGACGAGKSTLAAALMRHGYPFVNDDVCHVGVDRGRPAVLPDGRMLKLWGDAVESLALAARRGEAVRGNVQKFYMVPEHDVPTTARPLLAVYILRDTGDPHRQGIERCTLAEAAALLRQNAYRPHLVASMDLEKPYFLATTNLLAHARVFVLTRMRKFDRMPHLVRDLEAHWRDLGFGPHHRSEADHGTAPIVPSRS
jgi:hypothetical protein